MVNGSSLSKLGKRFSTNGSILETGTDSKYNNRIPQHYMQVAPQFYETGEYNDSPPKTQKSNMRTDSTDNE
jgi:hypothetical protein